MSKACTSRGRRFFAPEVIQTSAMDCGPAALKSLLEGFGVSVSYGRLREACQTDVDGTSIDTLEEVAAQLGLDAQQTMLPPDYLLHEAAKALPAIVVVRKPNGATHFVVVWRRLGPFVQVMDPASGTNWQTCEQFLGNLYVHTLPVSVELWREWAASDGLIPVLRHRLRALGASDADSSYIKTTFAQSDWQPLAALDSATRLVSSLVTAGGLKRGSESLRLLDKLFESAQQRREIIPEDYWCALPCPPTEGGEHVLLRGAVLIRVGGLLETEETPKPIEATLEEGQQTLSPELAAALQERPRRPGRELLSFLLAGGWVTPTLLVAGAILLGVMSAVDAVLLRSLLEMGRFLRGAEQHLLALSVLLVFFGGVLGLEGFLTSGFLRLGRHLEARLRKALQEKIPRLGDRYFHSRPTSDMAERSHSLHLIRVLPHMGGRFIQCLCELLITTAALIWISPSQGLVVLVSAAFAIGFLLAMQAPMMERDMRLRSHAGALSRNYLEALLGLTAVRTHGAERALRREHDAMLSEWVHAGRSLLQLSVGTEALQLLLGFGFAAWLVLGYVGSSKDTAGTLLLAYWALNVPLLAQQLGQMLREYPPQRNVTLRLIEPMGALEEPLPSLSSSASDIVEQSACNPVSIEFKGVSVRASGHLILEELDLRIEAGSHVALVGPSGAGKSSLVGLLLGWHRAACGNVRVNGAPLDAVQLAQLRRNTAWLEPSIQLWNQPLLDNLLYGSEKPGVSPAEIVEGAELHPVLRHLPEGFQSVLGEGGSLLSGGEGQRVRLGRAMAKPDARLVILDEPFRGLERSRRTRLLQRARSLWRDATLLCITHDVSETENFDRVLIINGGRLVEDGVPKVLASRENSLYRAMLETEAAVQREFQESDTWRRLILEDGRLVEEPSAMQLVAPSRSESA